MSPLEKELSLPRLLESQLGGLVKSLSGGIDQVSATLRDAKVTIPVTPVRPPIQ